LTLETWLLFCATEIILAFVPGPAVLCVISNSLTRGSRAGLLASLGILAANAVYFIISATGLGAVLLASRTVFMVIKWAGAVYLVYLGLRMLFARGSSGLAVDGGSAPARMHPFMNAFIVQIANPKALIFFAALLPQFVNPDESMARQIAILGVSSIVLEFGVLAVYVGACHAARRWVKTGRMATILERVGGALLIAAGAKLAATRGGL